MRRDRLPPRLRQALDETGVPWEIVPGSRHRQLRLDGRLVAILPRDGRITEKDRALRNVIAQVRRAVKRP